MSPYRLSTFHLRLLLIAAWAALAMVGCSKPSKPKLDRTYVYGKIMLEFPDRKHFRMTFEPGTRWAQFGPLEGETTEFGTFFALLPKKLSGKTEDEITQESYRLAQEQGIQVDLMAVGQLMRTIKTEIGEEGSSLQVTDPPANDPDKHPLAGAAFRSGGI